MPSRFATMRALRERYDGWPAGPNSWDEVHWEKLRDAPVDEIEETLRLVTFPERKAPQLKRALQRITERTGSLSLAFLARYRTEKIRRWVEELPGAGVKASAAVVNFSSLRRAAMAIDGHHQRIAIRVGVTAVNATPRQVEQALMPLVPAGWTPVTMDEHHTLVEEAGSKHLHASRSGVRALSAAGDLPCRPAHDWIGDNAVRSLPRRHRVRVRTHDDGLVTRAQGPSCRGKGRRSSLPLPK